MTEQVRSPLLPGGDLVAAVLDRAVMGLADRGGASNLVGDRWADVSADYAAGWTGRERPVPDGGRPLQVERIERLDSTPAVAALASRRGLQNPDLLLVGRRNGVATVQAADAKFSVETARAKQVSPEVVLGLLGLRHELPRVFEGIDADPMLVPGVFLCPDYPLTHLMLRRRHGIVRTTVHAEEVVLVPVAPDAFFAPLEGARVMAPLAAVDALPVSTDASLLAGLYYFRLARAAIGCWIDATKPLLLFDDKPTPDEARVAAEAGERATTAESAFGLLLRWNEDVQAVRNQRAAVDQVAGLPIHNRELRAEVERLALALGAPEPPSLNQVRRRLGAWWRGELRARVGPLAPPVIDLAAALTDVARVSRELEPRLPAEVARVVGDLVRSRSVVEDPLSESPSVTHVAT
jgi:hypothetical protein